MWTLRHKKRQKQKWHSRMKAWNLRLTKSLRRMRSDIPRVSVASGLEMKWSLPFLPVEPQGLRMV